jgi:hypothetical protein
MKKCNNEQTATGGQSQVHGGHAAGLRSLLPAARSPLFQSCARTPHVACSMTDDGGTALRAALECALQLCGGDPDRLMAACAPRRCQ